MLIHNFQLSVTPLGDDRYLIRTEQVEPGVPLAETQALWPVEQWLSHTQEAMDDPLVNLLRGTTRGDAQVAQLALDLRQLGQELYEALFPEQLRDSWIAAQSIANHQRATLRLRLGLRGDRLSRLPWEVLHMPAAVGGNQFQPLTTGTEILFSRYQTDATTLNSAPFAAQPLKILMVVTQPDDQSSLDLPQEIRHLKLELERGAHPAQLTLLEQPSRHDLAQTLEQGQYHIFHYAGHSEPGQAGGSISLVNPATGGTEPLAGEDLAGLLVNNGIQWAVFNSCRSSDTTLSASDEQSLSQALVKRGIPAVLAMAERVPDEVSLAFTRLLYRNVLQGYPVDLALNRARQGLLSTYSSSQLYWALPVLYLQPQNNGCLIALPNGTAPAGAIPAWLQAEIAQEAAQNPPPSLPPRPTEAEAAALLNSVFDDFAEEWVESDDPSTPTESTPPAALPVEVKQSQTKFQPWRNVGVIAGSVVAIAIAGGFFGSQLWQRQPRLVTTSPENFSTANENIVETNQLYETAIAAIAQREYTEALANVETLLDEGAVPLARTVLDAVPAEDIDDPEISFFKGRLAWEAWQRELDGFENGLQDARRFWETSARRQDNDPRYKVALGFAFYAEGRLNDANEQWQTAIQQLEGKVAANDPLLLNAYAGMALGLYTLATEQSPDRVQLLERARTLRTQVRERDPELFNTQALSQNWLWTESAIATWQLSWLP